MAILELFWTVVIGDMIQYYYRFIAVWRFQQRQGDNMRRIITLMAVELALIVFPVKAQDQSRRALAEELMNVMDARSQFDKIIALMKQLIPMQEAKIQQITGQSQSSHNVPEMQEKMFNLVSQSLNWDTLKDDFISIYAQTFTEDEMKGIIAFYKSPSGQALLQKQPQLMQKSLELSQKWMTDIIPKIIPAIQELSK